MASLSSNQKESSRILSPDRSAERILIHFLEETKIIPDRHLTRRPCPVCNRPKALFCPECFEILVDKQILPTKKIKLPFELDIILDDARHKSTGVQVATMLRALGSHQHRLIDLKDDVKLDYNKGSYFLFPGPGSVPLSSVLPQIQRLVVLDCKWTKSSARTRLDGLPRVHLDGTHTSYYWRWHNAGPGSVSTAEAIYYATWTASAPDHRESLVHMLWLFGIQRAVIERRSKDKELPFTEAGKEEQRSLRRRKRKQCS